MMSDIVFILGAGASRDCGGPLMSDFLEIAGDLWKSGVIKEQSREFEKIFNVISGLQVVHSKSQLDLNNIESIFTVLELGKVIQKVPGIESGQISEMIAALKKVIVTTLEHCIEYRIRNGEIHAPNSYMAFSNLLKEFEQNKRRPLSVSIITFNYDIALDMALHKSGQEPDYMIDGKIAQANSVPLMKLHGSLNWGTEKSTGKIVPLYLRDFLRLYEPSVLDVMGSKGAIKLEIGSGLSKSLSHFYKVDADDEPLIVPPSWNKADYHSTLSAVWASAANHLSSAEYIVVMGYSLPETDAFFRHLYALGSVGSSLLRKFIVCDLDNSGAVRERFERMLGPGAASRFEYRMTNFGSAVGSLRAILFDS